MFPVVNTIFVFASTMRISAERPITTFTICPSLFLRLTVFNSSISIIPSYFASCLEDAAVFEAVPPTWNVRNVNCVPGSPIDCAAITPTASPLWTIRPVARLRP